MHKFCSSEQFYAIQRIVPNTWFPLSGTKFTIISWILLRIHKFCSPKQFYAQVLQFGAILCNYKNCSEHMVSDIRTQLYIISWIWPRIRKFSSSEQFYAVLRIVPNTWFPLSGTKFTIISWILPRIHKFCSPEQFYAQVLQFGTILCNSKNCSEHVISVIWDQIYHNILNFTKNSQVL